MIVYYDIRNMPNKINVILFEIIVVLLLVAFGEFFYFTFYLSDKGPAVSQYLSQQPNTTSSCNAPPSAYKGDEIDPGVGCCLKSYFSQTTDKQFVMKTAETLIYSKKGIVKNLSLKAVYEGKVAFIGIDKEVNLFVLQILDPLKNNNNSILVSSLENIKEKIISYKGEQNKEAILIKVEDIGKYVKKSDQIRIEMLMELGNTRPSAYVISKLPSKK